MRTLTKQREIAEGVAETCRDLGQKILAVEGDEGVCIGRRLGPDNRRAPARQRQRGEGSGRQEMLPCRAVMVALVGGDVLGKNLHVADSFGFDLRDFNAIHPKKRPLYREDLAPVLLSDDVEAFRFDFCKDSVFPPQRKRIELTAIQGGRCYGVIQWIRIGLGAGVRFENHPSRVRPVSNWQHTIYGFGQPVDVQAGSVVSIDASHDRSRPWFDVAAAVRPSTDGTGTQLDQRESR